MASVSDNFLLETANRDARRERVSVAGQAYYLTATTLFRRPVFRDDEAARAVASLHRHPPVWGRSRCLAWVLLPDHWHGLVELGAGDSLEGLMRRFKSLSARAVEERHRINGWLWGRGFHDRALRDEESMRSVARYLVATPLRLGLARRIGDYPYWDAVWLETNGGLSLPE